MSVVDNTSGKVIKNELLVNSAAKSGDQILLKHLLDKGVSVHSVCPSGFTPLHYAVMSKHPSNVELLLKKGASIYARDNNGKTPLDLAIEIYKASSIEFQESAILILLLNFTLLDKGTTTTFSFLAVEKNDEELLKFILKKDPVTRINSTFKDNLTLLHKAAELNHYKLVNILIDYGADMHAKTFTGATALHLASAAGNTEVISQLLKKGVQVDTVDNNGCIPLHYAIRNNKRNVIPVLTNLPKTLTNRLNQGTSSYPSLLLYAVIRDDEEFFSLALKQPNVDLNPRTKDGETPLHFAIVYNRLTFIYELVKRGAEINARSSNGETPLHLAAALGQSYSVEFLLKNKADVNCLTSLGATPLHYTLDRERCNDIVGGYNRPLSLLDDSKPRFNIIRSLLNNRAHPNIRDHSGKTPLHHAMTMNTATKNNIKCRIDTIKCLVDHQANLNTLCKNGFTPLYYGFDTLDDKMLWWLIIKGADVKNNDQATSFLSRAIKSKNLKIIEVLLEAGVQVNSRNLSEVSYSNEMDKVCYFEVLEMLTNRIYDIKATITRISEFLSESTLTRESIMNRLIAVLVRRELINDIIIKEEHFQANAKKLRPRFSDCRDQVLSMKRIPIEGDDLSLYTIFVSSFDSLSVYSYIPKFKLYINSEAFVNQFPNCYEMLRSRYKKARMRKILLDVSSESLFNLIYRAHKIKLPLSVRQQVVQNLGIVDLTHLMQFKFLQGSIVSPKTGNKT